jgi:ubiquinone/menaquinone biosynthesis C-methylase UbiE
MKKDKTNEKMYEEYELFSLACPHFNELQNLVGDTIKKYFSKREESISVLEIGSGDGYTTKIILDSLTNINLTSVDNQNLMILKTNDNLREYISNKRLNLIEFDALEYLKKQKDNSIDIFASAFTLHNFNQEYRKEVLFHIYRILKYGSLFINSDKYAMDSIKDHEKSLKYQLTEFKRVFSKENRKDLLKEWTQHYLDDNQKDKVMFESIAIKQMKNLGFKEVKNIFREQMEATIIAIK